MRAKFLIVVFFCLLMSCSEEDLPAVIYDYQVERLLSGQQGTKAWSQIVSSTDCADSIKLEIELIRGSNDSLDISMITGCFATSTTLFVGRANASKLEDRDLFTDSLVFANGDYWIIERITSEILHLQDGEQSFSYSSTD